MFNAPVRRKPADLQVIDMGRLDPTQAGRPGAAVALRNAGIQAIVAESFSPGFWRGETFNGVPLITIPEVSGAVVTGDAVELDWRRAALTTADGRSMVGSAPSPRTVAVIEAGGSYELLLAEHRSKQPLTGQGTAR